MSQDSTLLIVTWDEHGGLCDRCAPPEVVAPDSDAHEGFDFRRYGVRMPAVLNKGPALLEVVAPRSLEAEPIEPYNQNQLGLIELTKQLELESGATPADIAHSLDARTGPEAEVAVAKARVAAYLASAWKFSSRWHRCRDGRGDVEDPREQNRSQRHPEETATHTHERQPSIRMQPLGVTEELQVASRAGAHILL
jgi:hypothetical protein